MSKSITFLMFIMISILCIFLLPYNIVFAEEETINGQNLTYTTTDDGSNTVSLDSVKFKLTCYGDGKGGSGFFCGLTSSDLAGYDEKYGWGYFEINGERYVAMAGALHDYISSSEWSSENGGFGAAGRKYNHIYYFKTGYNTSLEDCEKIQFKFENQDFDSNVYNGVIVDTGPAMMLPQAMSFYNDVENCNAIDIYMGADGETTGLTSPISGQVIIASSDGSFKSDLKKSSKDEIGFVEWLMDIFARYIHIPVGDGIQKIIDEAGTNLTEQEAKKILYSKQDLLSKNNIFYRYIEADTASSDKKTQTIKKLDISNELKNKDGETEEIFKSDTQIPVIPMDAYTMTTSNVELFNVNFLGNTTSKNNFWNLYKNLVNTLSHVVIYICSALLIGMLIWRSILLITSIHSDNSKLASESKAIMDNFVKAIVLIVGLYLFSTIMVYLYEYLTSLLSGETETLFNIRFVVNDVYSFNTNIISGVRYHTLSSNIGMEYKWSWIYLITALINGFWFLFMFLRMIVIGALVIISPITAVTTMGSTAKTKENSTAGIFFIDGWIKAFLVVLWSPMIVTAVMSIFLRI